MPIPRTTQKRTEYTLNRHVQHYALSITVDSDRVHSMSHLLDVICNAMERQIGLTEQEYDARVDGPPELSIGVVMK